MNILAFGIGNLGGSDLFIILLIVLVLFGAKNLLWQKTGIEFLRGLEAQISQVPESR